MGQDIMIVSLLVVAAGFGTLAVYALRSARRDRSKRNAITAAARQARSTSDSEATRIA
jgi:hypothetical protein